MSAPVTARPPGPLADAPASGLSPPRARPPRAGVSCGRIAASRLAVTVLMRHRRLCRRLDDYGTRLGAARVKLHVDAS